MKIEGGVEPSTKTRALRDKLLGQITAVDRVGYSQFHDLYEKLEGTLKMGAWECNLESNHLCWTPGTFDLFGIPRGSAVRREEVLEQYEADSRTQLETARGEAIRNGSGFSIEVDIFTRAATKNRLRINAAVEMSNGTPLRILGTKQLVNWTICNGREPAYRVLSTHADIRARVINLTYALRTPTAGTARQGDA